MSDGGEPAPAPRAAAARLRRRALLIGLMALPLAPQAWAGAAAPTWIELIMTEYRFTPDRLALRHGAAYRLVLDNRGKELHEFTAAAFLAASTIENRDLLDASGKSVVVKPGERQVLRFIAPRQGSYPFACADHDWAGMAGEIVVS